MNKKKKLKAKINLLERKNSELMNDVMTLVNPGNEFLKQEIKNKYKLVEEVKQMLLFGSRVGVGKLNNGLFDQFEKNNK